MDEYAKYPGYLANVIERIIARGGLKHGIGIESVEPTVLAGYHYGTGPDDCACQCIDDSDTRPSNRRRREYLFTTKRYSRERPETRMTDDFFHTLVLAGAYRRARTSKSQARYYINLARQCRQASGMQLPA